MAAEILLYVFKPGASLPPGRSGNKSQMSTIRISHAEYDDLLRLCGGAHPVLRSLAREVSRTLPHCAPGQSWTDTVLAATRIAAIKRDADEQAHADANNAAYAA